MGVAMELNDVVGYCDYVDLESPSDLTDTESDGEEYACSSKRSYDVFLDGGVGVGVGVGRKRSRVDEQLALLRAAIPNLCTNEKASILAGASEYIEKLLRQVQELHDELDTLSPCSDDGDVSSCDDDFEQVWRRPVDFNADVECCGCSHPVVEVVRTEEGGLKIHVQCEKRPRVLAAIMEVVESSGMNVDQVSIAYHDDSHFTFNCVGSEVDGNDAADYKFMETRLKSLIADHREPCVE